MSAEQNGGMTVPVMGLPTALQAADFSRFAALAHHDRDGHATFIPPPQLTFLADQRRSSVDFHTAALAV